MMKRAKHIFLMTLLVVAVTTSGCVKNPGTESGVDLTTSTFLTVFFNAPQTDQPLILQLNSLEIYSEPLWYPLNDPDTMSATGNSLSGRVSQQLIAAGSVGTGTFSRIRFKLKISNRSGKLIRQEQTEIRLKSTLENKPGCSSSLFITSSLNANTLDLNLAQQFNVYSQQRPLADELLYILCPDTQTLYVARVNPCQIVASYGVGSDIADMVIDNNRKELYLLDRTNHLIQRFDTIAQTFTDRLPLPLADEPNNIAISSDGNSLYVSDAYNRQLMRIDAENGNVIQRTNMGYQQAKAYPFTHQNQDYVALLSPREQQLTVLLAQSLTPIYRVNVGLQPFDVIYADHQLLVSDMFSRQILAIDPASGTVTARIATSQMPGTLCVDNANNNIIIGSIMDDTIAFLPFGQQLVARRSNVGGEVVDTAIASARRLLFAALKSQPQVSVIDLPSEKQIETIVTASPPAVIAFQEP